MTFPEANPDPMTVSPLFGGPFDGMRRNSLVTLGFRATWKRIPIPDGASLADVNPECLVAVMRHLDAESLLSISLTTRDMNGLVWRDHRVLLNHCLDRGMLGQGDVEGCDGKITLYRAKMIRHSKTLGNIRRLVESLPLSFEIEGFVIDAELSVIHIDVARREVKLKLRQRDRPDIFKVYDNSRDVVRKVAELCQHGGDDMDAPVAEDGNYDRMIRVDYVLQQGGGWKNATLEDLFSCSFRFPGQEKHRSDPFFSWDHTRECSNPFSCRDSPRGCSKRLVRTPDTIGAPQLNKRRNASP